MNAIAIIAAALLVVAAQVPTGPARVEPPPVRSGTSSIAGRVVDAAGKPIEGAAVGLVERPAIVAGRRPLTRSSKALTNRDGAYVFSDIAAGSYIVLVSDEHHLPTSAGVWIEILEGETRGDLNLQVRAGAIVRGRLIDQEGQPLSGVMVVAWLGDGNQMGGKGQSDADGRFEIRTAELGPAFIAAEISGRAGHGYSRVFYPGVLNREAAQTITMEAGVATDIELHVPEITEAGISAHLSGPDGYRIDQLTLLRPETKWRLPLNIHESTVSAINLRPGRYVLEARATAGDEALAASAVVDLQAVDIEVPLHLQPAGSVSGKIVLERGGLPPVDDVRVAAVWTIDGIEVKPSPDEINVGPDGVFRFTGLFGHRDFRVVGLPDDWQVTAIRAGRSVITASGLDIVSGSTTELTIVVARR